MVGTSRKNRASSCKERIILVYLFILVVHDIDYLIKDLKTEAKKKN